MPAPQPSYAAAPPPPGAAPYAQGYPAPTATGYPTASPMQPYGQPPVPGHGPVGYPYRPPYDGFAIAGFALSLVGGTLLAIVFGIMGISRTRGGRARGRGLAIAALVIAPLWIVVAVVMFVVGLAGDGPGSSYAVGDCVQLDGDAGADVDEGVAPAMPSVPCAEPHDGEVYAAKDLPAGPYPGLDQVQQQGDAYCASEFEAFVGVPYDESRLELFYVYPQQVGWLTGDREIACVVTDVDAVTGTLRGAAR
ncbi:septum formation family protein [Cellulomonas sp. DKR-3]|uniref:Septum formation family protein n=1 Tax=Cellulomonas fulva TaxID=2835530 RepID=A0ABS5TWK3_9CELL|nr:septum formation family protein [Cellulomonas fulva]MBT0993520.1 septum formation family protein [Cellulomonas fulva]